MKEKKGVHMPERTRKPLESQTKNKNENRETQILNLLCNISLLLMITITEAFSEMFTTLSKEFITALTNSLDPTQRETKKLDELQKQFPEKLRTELLAMKQDLIKQMQEKRHELGPLLEDKRFDNGITIVEHSRLPLPKLTQDLDEATLLGYLALLQANDPQFIEMFQQLLEWMNNLPQLQKKE